MLLDIVQKIKTKLLLITYVTSCVFFCYMVGITILGTSLYLKAIYFQCNKIYIKPERNLLLFTYVSCV